MARKVSGLVNNYYMPAHKQEATVALDRMSGGLNLYDLPDRLDVNETPDVRNLHWRDGALHSRDGQQWVMQVNIGGGYACYESLYYGHCFYHIGNKIYSAVGDLLTEVYDLSVGHEDFVPRPGVFFRYQDYLMYKAPGTYIKIAYDGQTFTATDLSLNAYVPTILINAVPYNGSGDLYQPENRLSPKKTVLYNALLEESPVSLTWPSWSNTLNRYYIRHEFRRIPIATITAGSDYEGRVPVYVDTVMMDGSAKSHFSDSYRTGYPVSLSNNTGYSYSRTAAEVLLDKSYSSCEGSVGIGATADFDSDPDVVLIARFACKDYYLPLKNVVVDSVEAIMSNTTEFTTLVRSTAVLTEDPTKWNSDWDGDYVYWPATGHVMFKVEPFYFEPFVNNTVKITYTLPNETAYDAIINCDKAVVYGGDQSVCIIMSGNDKQVNSFYWNGNGSYGMDPSYFPIDSYNLVGDNLEPITGFGIQQAMLVIFKEHSVWKSTMGTDSLNGRTLLTFNTVGVNNRIGCDMPGTIQLIENNLVFCNKTSGIMMLLSTSNALENNIQNISRKVNGTPTRPGILDKAKATTKYASFDDDQRYWLVIGSEVYVWEYELSTSKDPSFFFYDNIPARYFLKAGDEIMYLRSDGKIVKFVKGLYDDFNAAIPKHYVTPTMHLGSYEQLKDVTIVDFQIPKKDYTEMSVQYITNAEKRYDLTDIRHEENDEYSVKRKPGCKRIRSFAVKLESLRAGVDLSIASMQIYYFTQGRIR